MATLVVLPSYNESQNILELTEAILGQDSSYDVCVVDDSSPDGTSNLVRQALDTRSLWKNRVHLITRTKKNGRGGAVRDGFVWGLSSPKSYQNFVEMDCDFSHDPKSIVDGMAQLGLSGDVIIGSRYPNGKILGWPWHRKIFSLCANVLTRTLISREVTDYTTGFRIYTRAAVEFLTQKPQQHKGYIYLSESLAHLLKAGFRVGSFPIVFRNRERGVSNTSLSEVFGALSGIFKIAKQYRAKDI